MKTLYESILDNDDIVMKKSESTALPFIIVKNFLQDIGHIYINQSPIKEWHGSFIVGNLEANYIYKYDFKNTIRELDKHILKFKKSITKTYGVKFDLTTSQYDDYLNYAIIQKNITISHNRVKYNIEIYIRENKANNICEYIMIRTKDKELYDLLIKNPSYFQKNQ